MSQSLRQINATPGDKKGLQQNVSSRRQSTDTLGSSRDKYEQQLTARDFSMRRNVSTLSRAYFALSDQEEDSSRRILVVPQLGAAGNSTIPVCLAMHIRLPVLWHV